jgi:hypothetical protein
MSPRHVTGSKPCWSATVHPTCRPTLPAFQTSPPRSISSQPALRHPTATPSRHRLERVLCQRSAAFAPHAVDRRGRREERISQWHQLLNLFVGASGVLSRAARSRNSRTMELSTRSRVNGRSSSRDGTSCTSLFPVLRLLTYPFSVVARTSSSPARVATRHGVPLRSMHT